MIGILGSLLIGSALAQGVPTYYAVAPPWSRNE
jgi:hypothetical protein